MEKEEILKRAISKAVENGWKDGKYHLDKGVIGMCSCALFSHDFAKAFWGGEYVDDGSGYSTIPEWQYHLQQMVLEKDPIKYLSKFI